MGGSSKSQVIGYEYYMGVQLTLTHGPVDAVLEIQGDDRQAWAGRVTDNATVTINKRDLFGGAAREGGWDGLVDIRMGAQSQGKSAYMQAKAGGEVSADRGVLTMIFRGYGSGGFMWSMINPYFKSPAVQIFRAREGWARPVFYPQKAIIGTLDMNPAHIIYECLTDFNWGMGYSPADVDEPTFRECADTLFNEGFGMSLLWMEQTSLNDFISLVLNHIDGVLYTDMRTGKFKLHLTRQDYLLDDLPLFDPDNILEMSSFQRVTWGDTANEITVKYTDRNQKEAAITVQDLASIDAQGGRVIPATKDYIGVRDGDLAVRLATRDLNIQSSTLAKVVFKTTRAAWDMILAQPFRLTWPRLGIVNAAFRITSIDKGNLAQNEIEIEALEDVFGLPTQSYVEVQPSGWVSPIQQPAPVTIRRTFEAPYYDVIQAYTAADIDYFDPDYGFGELAAVEPTSATFGYQLWASPNGSSYTEVAPGEFTPSGTINTAIPRGRTDVTVTLNNASQVDPELIGGYAYIDDEAFSVLGVSLTNPLQPSVTLGRAVIDTVPVAHAVNARVWFAFDNMGYDPTQRSRGETVQYKPLTRTGQGVLDLDRAVPVPLTLAGRAQRPYPPGNLQINGLYWPATITGPLTATWAHRDRVQQTAGLVPFSASNIGPEPGTTYTVRVLRVDGTVVRTYSGITDTVWTYPAADAILDGNMMDVRLQIFSVRDSLQSWQTHDLTVRRTDLVTTGFGLDFGNNFGGAQP